MNLFSEGIKHTGWPFIIEDCLHIVNDHQPSAVVYNFGRVCLSVCLNFVMILFRCDCGRRLAILSSAGLTIVPVVPWEGAPRRQGPPINCQIFTTPCVNVWTYVLKHNDDWKKGRQLSGGKKSAPSDRKNPGYAYEKRAPPYVGMGPLNGSLRALRAYRFKKYFLLANF